MGKKTDNREEIVEVDHRFALLLKHCARYKENLERLESVTIEVTDSGTFDRPNLAGLRIRGV